MGGDVNRNTRTPGPGWGADRRFRGAIVTHTRGVIWPTLEGCRAALLTAYRAFVQETV